MCQNEYFHFPEQSNLLILAKSSYSCLVLIIKFLSIRAYVIKSNIRQYSLRNWSKFSHNFDSALAPH